MSTRASGQVNPHTINGTGEKQLSQKMLEGLEYEVRDEAEMPRPAAPRKSDPMSISNMLSADVSEAKKPETYAASLPKAPESTSPKMNGDNRSTTVTPRRSTATKVPSPKSSTSMQNAHKNDILPSTPPKNSTARKRKQVFSVKDNEKILKEIAKIDAMGFSDLECEEFEEAKLQHAKRAEQRTREIGLTEESKRKRRRTAGGRSLSSQIGSYAEEGRQRFRALYEAEVQAQVHQKEIQDDKERKKDMQRKRRRERALQTQAKTYKDASEKAQTADNDDDRERAIKEAQRAEKRLKTTKRALERREESDGIREVTPLAPNLEGGMMGTFQTASNLSPEPPRKKIKAVGASRPKKSKEKKEAEKAAAEAGFAAGLHTIPSNEPVAIAPKEDSPMDYSRETRQSRSLAMKDASLSTPKVLDYDSKGYSQIYEQIWKDIAKKDVPKVFRIKENSLAMKQSNLRKTVQLASKEARRWQWRTNKGTKDVQARAKRSMREMMGFWKRNEKAERDLRKNAEKQELENAKKAEADRESNRQKRKLNFLIEQTELYSHFIGRKIKTDEIEKSTDSAEVATSSETVQAGKADAHTVTLPDGSAKTGSKVTNFEQLDFDADDDTALREAAMANAQNAVEEAQARARAFNSGGDDLQAQFDDGEMNFQNPTGMGDINIAQPKMLAAQLKEYQLKGLNWLVNLYEQGINGILADEMGLGKTIQSISVMGYLAEKYNIWGPFLVIAPSSTLHNWQQEITRFLPGIKCLPYWGTAKDRKILRKFWDRKHITYNQDSTFHVLITSYQLVVQDTQYFQKMRWQYMILDEAQAIKSSQSSRWKCLLGFHCRNRLLLTGTPIQNNMQELWALLHFIMPSLFDSHDEFSEWFSKDIESHAQSNTKLNEDQLKRLHMILKPFMLRRVKKHVQKELGDKEEKDVFCDLTYRQRAFYTNLRNKISIMDLIEKAAVGDDQDTATLMNLVMQFRKVCNHPDLFERADTSSPLSLVHYAETASFLREGNNVNVAYSSRNIIEYDLPRLLCSPAARLDVAGPSNAIAGSKGRCLSELMNIWTPENIQNNTSSAKAFSWLRFANTSVGETYKASRRGVLERAVELVTKTPTHRRPQVLDEDSKTVVPSHALFNILERNDRRPLADIATEGRMKSLLNVSRNVFQESGLSVTEQYTLIEKENTIFNVHVRKALYGTSEKTEAALLEAKLNPNSLSVRDMLPEPVSQKARYTNIQVPSMSRFVTDSGKLAKLDQLLRELKEGGHRVLLYFQMTRMIDLMEEYLTFRNYKYLRLDGSTKLEDRRDTVADFQTKPEMFIFLLSTRAGGLGINLTAADTVIFYDSDWNPTIDSQAMDRAHRLGQTKQVTVYRMITRGTIEERIRKRALQKEEVQRVVISGGSGAGVDFNTRSKENRTKDIALWLADDEQAEMIEKKEAEVAAKGDEKARKKKGGVRKKEISLDDMYHEGEGHFDDNSNKPSGTATPIDAPEPSGSGRRKGVSKKAKTIKQRLAVADGSAA
ncbi:putative DNA helicase ino80 [Bacidia gigantensis]|uniref:putative DNA helicase ino80 n=1 Tax=Bacidia gigantensis TaxID=2732470 RepID=UPI001D03CC61|nr:putative DNA helicase ino80 [Bacidia gigantensis]KAG8532196.1 putative DNA helicase ino80 [Bacidia gigantensis]